MKTTLKIIGLLFIVLSFSACDVIDNPIKAGGTRPPVDTTVVVRKAVIEDFTGHRCKNCPYAAEEIHKLQGLYGDDVIGIAIHAGPLNFTGTNADYPTDFTTLKGTAIYNFFKIPALPMGMVNRVGYTGTGNGHLKAYSSWPTLAAGILDSVAHIKLAASVSYSAADSTATVNVEATALKDFTDDLKIVVMLTESGIVSPQLMPNDTRNVSYVHQHVFRDAFTYELGDEFALAPITVGSKHIKQIAGTVHTKWIPANCDIVVYVFNARTYEILQAEQIKLIP